MGNRIMEFDDYHMRLIENTDGENYYKYAFEEASKEAHYFTGTLEKYTKEQVLSFVEKITKKENRYDFLILRGNEIIGEIVLNEIKETNCHFRICIYIKKKIFQKALDLMRLRKLLNLHLRS